eukprot:TRINITY_DN57152_c0_g1_i1.p3 TRINITY_DN57152_c0_g1~~TRINITY_DN57152_c0_g1_i1.p3  ORF type:complete len:138 (+),score=14.18 TRINITY_DN57152_c0_g1_i1:883-1296(+)
MGHLRKRVEADMVEADVFEAELRGRSTLQLGEVIPIACLLQQLGLLGQVGSRTFTRSILAPVTARLKVDCGVINSDVCNTWRGVGDGRCAVVSSTLSRVHDPLLEAVLSLGSAFARDVAPSLSALTRSRRRSCRRRL